VAGPRGAGWLRSENAPGFTPLGPWIVPADSIADPSDLQAALKLNGETMQDESTKDMISTSHSWSRTSPRTPNCFPAT
jgi:2,4-diketo-3-deoxy-L-fuconate hydrolase